MNKLLLLAAALVGGAAGAGVACLVQARTGPAPAAGPAAREPAATETELRSLREGLAKLDARLATVETRPGLAEALDDPATRERLAAVVGETRSVDSHVHRPAPVGAESWRRDAAARVRADYAKVTEEALRALGADPARQPALRAILEKHFAPVEACLKDFESGKAASPPKVNELVAPGLAATLESLKAAVGTEPWTAFEGWRRSSAESAGWGTTRGEYFLAGEDYRNYCVERAGLQHWAVLRQESGEFVQRAGLNADARGKLEAILRTHVARLLEAVRDDEHLNLTTPAAAAKARALTKDTEGALAAALGPECLPKFREWLTGPNSRVALYFGETPRPARPMPPRPLPVPSLPQPAPAPGPETGAAPGGRE